MSKRKDPDAKPKLADAGRGFPPVSSAQADTPLAGWIPSSAALRETVESIVIAFVLAFLFRTFEAEAFVIPTGSMAPTLMGRHKDVYCPRCGYEYQVSASEPQPDAKGIVHLEDAEVRSGTCPMCRYTADISAVRASGPTYEAFSGDRILVGKFPYQSKKDPDRWDVIVFKFPGEAATNYIKRLVGLPGETIRIQYGNLWLLGKDGQWEIARKGSEKLLAMLQPVYDNDLAPKLRGMGWPDRWQPAPPTAPRSGDWSTADGAVFQSSPADGETWLRYQHLVPSYQQWQEMLNDKKLRPGETIEPQLISDFTAYNTGGKITREEPDCSSLGIHWVGDLALKCELDVQSPSGLVILELIKGGRRFQCRFDISSGVATLGISGSDATAFEPSAQTTVQGIGCHRVMFSNVDDELRLWVDGRVVKFQGDTTYKSAELQTHVPTVDDLSPAGVATAAQAVAKVSHIELLRDLYYIANQGTNNRILSGREPNRCVLADYIEAVPQLADSNTWKAGFAETNMRAVEFRLAPKSDQYPEKDQFLVLGDNGAQSKDSRLWGSEYWVSRELLVGKAMLIYWPHSWNQLPFKEIPFPYFPNFKRMHLVR